MTPVVLGIDVGGTEVKCAAVTPEREVCLRERHPTGPGAGIVARVLDIAERLATRVAGAGLTPVAAGIALPGLVDEARGVARYAVNLGLHRPVPVRDPAQRRLGLPVQIGQDIRAGALAEATLGAGAGSSDVLVVIIGTGIGCGHIVDGRLRPGAHATAGELGHVVVRPGGPDCACGGRGCLEAIGSAGAIARRYTAATGRPAAAAEVARRAAAGEPAAVAVWDDAVAALADALVIAQSLLDPGLILLGGGLARAGDQLLTPLRAAVAARLTFQAAPHIGLGTLADEAGCLGAALLALSGLETEHGRSLGGAEHGRSLGEARP